MNSTVGSYVGMEFRTNEQGQVVLRIEAREDGYPLRPADRYVVEIPSMVIPAE